MMMAVSVSLKACLILVVLCMFATVTSATTPCSTHDGNQPNCVATTGCAYRMALCVNSLPPQYLWVTADTVHYGQLLLSAGQTLDELSYPNETFHGPQVQIVAGQKVETPPGPMVPRNPHLHPTPTSGGRLIPWDSNTTHYRDTQPPLVQPMGTFAYIYENPPGPAPPVAAFPKLDSFEFYYQDASGDKYWSTVEITIVHPTLAVDEEAYRCKDTTGGTKGGATNQPWGGPYSYGSSDVCFRGSTDTNSRPWVTRQQLPRVWSEVTNPDPEEYQNTTYGPMIDGVEIRFVNNRLNITANGRLGQYGQRVYGFDPMRFDGTWDLDTVANIPQTMSFDKACVSAKSQGTGGGYEFIDVFAGLPHTGELNASVVAPQCPSWNHGYLCANAPFLTVESGTPMIPDDVTNLPSPHAQPWSTLLDDCMVWTTGIFRWDLVLGYCTNGKYAAPGTSCSGSHVFNVQLVGSDQIVTFDFYNTAIQPASHLSSQKDRGWIERHHKYEVTLTLSSRLDFAFETGIDIFTVDIQWFRYASVNPSPLPTTVAGQPDRGLGINLVVYPEGYDAVYTPTDAFSVPGSDYKVRHNQVPKKVTSFLFYADPDVPSQVPTGLDPANRPQGMPSPYLGDTSSYNAVDEHLKVHTCAPSGESVGTATNLIESCDFQNLTVRIRQPNLGEDTLAPGQEVGTTWAWDGRLIFQFTLLNGEHPNFIMDMNYKQTALAVEGSFSGRSATCRTYPELVEAEVQSRDPNIPVQGVEQAPESQCAPGGVSLTEAQCGPSARESDGPSGPGFGCVWNYHRQTCIPGYSVTCQEPDAHVFGPTDRAIVVFDITNVDASCVSVHTLHFEWTSGGITHKAYAVYPTGQTPPPEVGKVVAHVFPQNPGDSGYEYFKFNPLSELERNMYPLPQTNLWDYGFVFFPGAVNDNVAMQIVAVLRISTSCAVRQNRRFRSLQAGSSSEMSVQQEMKLTKTEMGRGMHPTPPQHAKSKETHVGASVSTRNGPQEVKYSSNNTPMIIMVACMVSVVAVAAVVAVLYVKFAAAPRNAIRAPSSA